MLCLPRHLRRLGLLIFLVTVLGCSDTSREVAPERKTARVVERDDKRTWLPIRPSKPVDPQPRIVATIKARGGKAMVDEAGIVAIDWQRAPIHNLDLELLTETPALRRLYLAGTKIDSRGWMYLSFLPKLERLALWRTPIVDEDLKFLAGAKNLEVLDLNHTRITGAGLAYLSDCRKLETLILKNTPYQARYLPEILRLKSLRVLDIWGVNIPSRMLVQLKALPRLEELRMYHNPRSLPYVAELPHIRRISLPAAAFHGPKQNFAPLARMKKLEVVEAGGHGIRDSFFEHVSQCPNLRELRVRGASKFTDAGLAHLADCKSLRWLDVRDTKATADGLRVLAQANPRLKIAVNPIELHRLRTAFRSMGLGAKHSRDGGARLRLDREMNITAVRLDDAKVFLPSLKLIAQAVDPEQLEHLSLGHTDLTDEGLTLFRGGANLRHLNLAGTKITAAGLKQLGGGDYPELPRLETLDLSGTTLDDDCLAWIATLDRLKTLRLGKVKGLTEQGWDKLRELPHLETLEK